MSCMSTILVVSGADLDIDTAALPLADIEMTLQYRPGLVATGKRGQEAIALENVWMFTGDIDGILDLAEHLAREPRVWSKIEHMSFSEVKYYSAQCNLEYSPQQMARLVKLGLSLKISCVWFPYDDNL